MKSIKMRGICAAVTGALMFGFGANAMADSSVDIVNALIAKGVLTEEEGALITKGAKEEKAANAKAIKKAGKLSVSDAVDNAQVYGDIRVRYEDRDNSAGTGFAAAGTPNAAIKETHLQRSRYKVTLGVKTDAGPWYSDLALSMGAKGRSDNADFGSLASNEVDSKQALFLKRAMVGYKATDWLTLEAGRMSNPLYTSSMVWDADLNVEGLAEKFNYKYGNAEFFGTAFQSEYLGVRKLVGGVVSGTNPASAFGVAGSGANGSTTGSAEQFAFQAGVKYAFNDRTTGKAALTFTTYSKNPYSSNFGAGMAGAVAGSGYSTTATTSGGTTTYTTTANAATASAANGSGSNQWGVNNLNIWELPAEINYMVKDNVGIRLFEHTAWNTDADARAAAAGISGVTNSSTADGMAWSLGVQVASAKDLKAFEGNKMAKGDWSARLWYQSVGAWAVDAALVDSDIFDGRTNMEGTAFKAQYNIEDNVLLNFTAAHGEKKNQSLYAFGIGDLGGDLTKLDLLQFDLTYKF